MELGVYSVPPPKPMGQGLYKPWIAATAGETLWTHSLPFAHKRVGLSVVLRPTASSMRLSKARRER